MKRITRTDGCSMTKLILRWTIFALAYLMIAPCLAAGKGYIMGPGDVIKVTVFQNPEMATETRVSEIGTITFPLVGTVEVGGLTTAQAEVRIAGLLKVGNFVPRAQINVLVTQFRSRQICRPREVVLNPRVIILEFLTQSLGALGFLGRNTLERNIAHHNSQDVLRCYLLGLA